MLLRYSTLFLYCNFNFVVSYIIFVIRGFFQIFFDILGNNQPDIIMFCHHAYYVMENPGSVTKNFSCTSLACPTLM